MINEFSVLMSVYKKENSENLDKALESMFNQTLMPNEIVLIQDGELTKELENVIAKYKNKYPDILRIYAYTENKGLSYALNLGIQQCKYEYVARMDTDDISHLDRFEKQIKYLSSHPQIDILGAQIDEFDDSMKIKTGTRHVPIEDKKIKKKAKWINPFNHQSVIYKKSKILEVGNYQNVKLEDYDLWGRMIKDNCNMHNLNEVLVDVRAGDLLYTRRSTKTYVVKIVEIQKKLLEYGVINKFEYCRNVLLRSILALIPVSLKRCIYPKVIRKI